MPDSRVRDCIYFSPADINHPIALNIMEDVGHGKRHLVASSMMSAFKKIWGEESWSDRMEHILNNTPCAVRISKLYTVRCYSYVCEQSFP